MSDDMRNATQGALALYLNEVQPVDGRVQINVSIDELTVLRHLAADTPAAGGEALEEAREYVRNLWRSKALREREHYDLIAIIDKAAKSFAAQPAPPLRGRDYDQIALDAAYQIEALPTDLHDAQKTARIQLIVLDALAAPQEQPLRGRDGVLQKWQEKLADLKDMKARGDLTRDWGECSLINAQNIVDDLTASASPPEQPAADPSAEADEAHADLLRRLDAVPKEEKE